MNGDEHLARYLAAARKAVAMERDRGLPPIGVRLRAHCAVCKSGDPTICAQRRNPETHPLECEPCNCECHDPTGHDAQENEG